MTVRGWCPSLFAPMESGDGLLSRIKPFTPVLTAADLRTLDTLARRHGNGLIELTSRANLQFRGLTTDSAADFAQAVTSLHLASADPATEQRRNITISPLAGHDPACAADTRAMAQHLAETLAEAHELAGLPGKFHFAVDGGGALPLARTGCDVLLRADRGTWLIGCEGGFAVRRPRADAADAARRLARICAARHSRMRDALSLYGDQGLFALAGLAGAVPMKPAQPSQAIGPLGNVYGLGLQFGRLDAPSLATLAETFGDATLRLTPWRSVLLTGVADPTALIRAATDLIVTPFDPASRIIACPGRPACASAAADIRADAKRLQTMVPPDGILHLSGCAKGCAHPGPAAITLVATETGYRLIRHGRAGDAPQADGLDLPSLLAQRA
jgi:precorrin-3B synthase